MLITIDGRQVNITPEQKSVLDVLAQVRHGGFASVIEYSPESNYVTRPVQNIQFVSKFSYLKRNNKLLERAEAITLDNLKLADPKLDLPAGKLQALFDEAKSEVVMSLRKTMDGDRSDSHRQAHDKFYIQASMGVKVHLQTEKVNGKTRLVTENGVPMAKSIMVSVLEVGKQVLKEGECKKVNSRSKTLMKKAIIQAAEKGMLKFKMISLKSDNFKELRLGGEVVAVEDLEEAKKEIQELQEV